MTNINTIIQQTIKQLIVECHDDYVGLWSVIAALKHNGIKVAPIEMRKITMKVIQALLNEKDIVAAEFRKNEDDYFHVWNFSYSEILARIEKEWTILGHEPTLGDIVWFTSKDLIVYQRKRVDSEKIKIR